MPVETFLEKCREVVRLKHLSYRTEQTYLSVIRRFIEFHGGRRHPRDMGAAEIRAYLSHLAVEQNVAASTQNVAFSALLFLYREVLHIELPAIEHVERAQRPARLPEVFTREEARNVIARMEGTPRPMARSRKPESPYISCIWHTGVWRWNDAANRQGIHDQPEPGRPAAEGIPVFDR